MIVPNPESALNEEAGRLLLEQYDDYAKRARLYTSIQAKAGKSEFISLSKERSHNEENEGAPKDDATVSTPIIEEKQITSTTSIATNTSVLKALSNTSTTNNINNKRLRSSQENESQQPPQPEIKKVKKAMTATGQKKKSLRRL